MHNSTTIRGIVTDAVTKEPVATASVYFKGPKVLLPIRSAALKSKLLYIKNKSRLSYIGYKTQTIAIEPGKEQTIQVQLSLDATKDLSAVVIKNKRKIKYTNKDNPAVEFIRNVIAAKDKNRPEHYHYVEFEQYDKIQLSLSRISEKITKNKLLKPYGFVFENTDTTKVAGKSLTPIYLEEKLATNYYRKDPRKNKTVVEGEKRVNFGEFLDSAGVSSTLKRLYEDINVYENNISVFTNQFLSPIADLAPSFYMYFIRDTLTDMPEKSLSGCTSHRETPTIFFFGAP